jgi:hypothetical protein
MAKRHEFLAFFRRKFLDHMLDDLAFWRPSKTLHEVDAAGGVPKPPPPPPPPQPPPPPPPRRRRRAVAAAALRCLNNPGQYQITTGNPTDRAPSERPGFIGLLTNMR